MRRSLFPLLISISLVAGIFGWPTQQRPSLDSILASLNPRPGDSALLIGFDTDVSKDSESYVQYYDYTQKTFTKPPTNRTVLLTRIGGEITRQRTLDFIASPQRDGFIFLGMARYFEPKPRRRNDYLSEYEKPGSDTNLFGFDYTRIWITRHLASVERERRETVARTKAEVDSQFRKSKEKEWEQNISDYQKIGFRRTIHQGWILVENNRWSGLLRG
jgi:hypothetical protein